MASTLAHRIIKARSGHGWSQQDLAEVSGVAPAQISRYEAGRNKPRNEILAKLANAMGVRFEWLAYDDGDIDGGASVPAFPSSHREEIVLELDDEMFEVLRRTASDRGVTMEMAFKSIVVESLGKGKPLEQIGKAHPPEAESAEVRKAALPSNRVIVVGNIGRDEGYSSKLLNILERGSHAYSTPPDPVPKGPARSPNARQRVPKK